MHGIPFTWTQFETSFALFLYFRLFKLVGSKCSINIFCRWLDSNLGPQELEAAILPTEQNQSIFLSNYPRMVWLVHIKHIFISKMGGQEKSCHRRISNISASAKNKVIKCIKNDQLLLLCTIHCTIECCKNAKLSRKQSFSRFMVGK